jgi:hypothetical protein
MGMAMGSKAAQLPLAKPSIIGAHPSKGARLAGEPLRQAGSVANGRCGVWVLRKPSAAASEPATMPTNEHSTPASCAGKTSLPPGSARNSSHTRDARHDRRDAPCVVARFQ